MHRPLTFVAALAVCAVAVPGQDRLSPELLWKLGRVSDAQAHPSADRVLFHVREYDLAANGGVTQIHVLDVGTDATRALTTAGSNFNGRWSPDGSQVGFLSTRDGAPQVYVIDVDGGEARRVTSHPGGVGNFAWSPDGTMVSFTADVRLEPTLQDLFSDLPEAEARIYDDLMVRHWDTWKDGTYSHLFVAPVDGSAPARDLMQGMRVDTPLKPFGGGEEICWAPDSKSLIYTAKRVAEPQESTDSNLYEAPIDGGAHVNLTDGMPGYDMVPAFSPDGRHLAFTSMARDGYESDQNRLMVLDRESGEIRRVDDWDGTVGEFAWLPDGSGFLLACDWRGSHHLFRLPLSGGAPQPITSGRMHVGGLSPAAGGEHTFAFKMTTERPNELVRITLGDGKVDALTDLNGAVFAGLDLPSVEERWFDATDGEKVHAWIIKPPGFDPAKRYPMLTYCQGGPQSQVGQWFSFRWNFHLMAAQGYVVCAINRRGLPGFGTKWNEDISGDWGGQAMNDLLSATDQMFAEPWIDRERCAAVGASFGGYSVYWLMGHDQDDRFAAMIAHCGVFNLESMYLSTEELFFVNWDLGGPFWKDPAIQADYDRFSPHRFVQHWDTPLLVIHGQKDFRVPMEQGLQAFTAAQTQGVPSRFVYFPDESHWVLSPQNGVLWHRLFFDWLQRHCPPNDG